MLVPPGTFVVGCLPCVIDTTARLNCQSDVDWLPLRCSAAVAQVPGQLAACSQFSCVNMSHIGL
jgi:hypothetical protein